MSNPPDVSSRSSCREAIHEIVKAAKEPLTVAEIRERVEGIYPNDWSRDSIRLDTIGSTVNHPLRRHYPSCSRRAFLFRLDDRKHYRLWNPATDGVWRETATGVELIDSDELGTWVPANESESEIVGSSAPELVSSSALSLERDLEACLLSRISELEPGLRLWASETFRYQQLETGAVGRLDLLAIDSQGRFVVIELKAGTADDPACGQILRYMGWVKTELAARDKEVRGMIVAHDFTERLRFAAAATPQVTLKHYKVSFQFEDSQPVRKAQ